MAAGADPGGRAEGGGLSEGVTGRGSASPPFLLPPRCGGPTGGVPAAGSTQSGDGRFPRSELGSRNFVWGAGPGSGREGGRGARARSPAPVPRSDPRGEGAISARRRGSWGRELRGGGGGPSPRPLLGRGSGSALVPSLASDQLVPDPLAPEGEGRTRLGKGRHVGGRTPFRRWGRGSLGRAVGSGRAVHAPPGSRAPGQAASRAGELPRGGGWDGARGWRRARPGGAPEEPPTPGKPGLDPQ